jgi:hypothetical protein
LKVKLGLLAPAYSELGTAQAQLVYLVVLSKSTLIKLNLNKIGQPNGFDLQLVVLSKL